MARGRTSIHRLNADRGLGYLQSILYLILNWVNNLGPSLSVDPGLEIRNFFCKDMEIKWLQLFKTSSPSRKLSDLFWLNLPWNHIKAELGNIHILDTGCGSGNLGPRLMDWSGHTISSYMGTDITEHQNWEVLRKKDKRLHFVSVGADHLLHHIPDKVNFILSQSAIEHFDHDLTYFLQIKEYIHRHQNPVIQVHLIPSSACLRLYRLHGTRQYTPRTISKITRLFDGFSFKVLFNLGGETCNSLHYEFIVKSGKDLRDLKTQEYDWRSMEAIQYDMANPNRNPAFYALVIHSNWKKKLFDLS